jgi:hypothetical protein
MATLSVELTDTEMKAMEYVALSPVAWADNAVTNRARIAIDEIVSIYTQKALNEGVQIPTTREAIVADAFAKGWVKTAVDREAEANGSI